MRRLVALVVLVILFLQFIPLIGPIVNVRAEAFRSNVRVDSNIGLGTIRTAPSIVADDGNIYIVWHDNRNGGSDIFYTKSSNQGVSFLFDVKVNDNPEDGTYQQNPDVAAYDGDVYVVWEDGRAGIGSYEIYFARSTDGFNFGPSIKVSDSGTEERNPSIAVDMNTGFIYVVWASQKKEIRLARSVDGGDDFESSVFVSDSWLYEREYPDVAVNSTGNVYVAWSDARLGTPPFWIDYYDVFVANSTDEGLSFGSNMPVNEVDTDVLQFRPSITIDGKDVLHVVWEDERNGNRDIYYSRSFDGSNFGEDVIVNDPYVHPRNPSISHQSSSIAVHQSGSPIYVVWTDNRAGNHSVYLAESMDDGDSFHTATSGFDGNYFFDSNVTYNGGRNSNEAVVLDDDNGILDPGVINGLDSPDRIVVPGQANLAEDLWGHRIRFSDINGDQAWNRDEDVVVDGPVILYPRVKPMRINPQDTTAGNFPSYLRWDLRNGDSLYYTTEKDERMVVGWFDIANAKDESLNPDLKGLKSGDPISGVNIEIAYKTDGGYDGLNFLTWSQALAVENPFFQISDTGDSEVYETIDLFALGVDTVEKLEQLNISFINDASTQCNVSINSMFLAIERGLPDGYDIYDYLVYNGSADVPVGMTLTNLSDDDNLMFIDGSGNGLYNRGEPLLVSVWDVDPGGMINETFEVLTRGDGPHWDAVFEPFPLNDDLDNSWQERPDIAIDSSGNAFIVWRDLRHWPLSDSIYFTTSASDDVPPEILECIPANGAAEIQLNATITFIFSEPMQSDTTSYVTISPQTNGLWFWNWDKTNLTFIPDDFLRDNQTYSLSISGGKDRSGNELQSSFSCSFRTVEGPAIFHSPPKDTPTVGEPIDVLARISDNDTVDNAMIFYVNIGETFFSQTNMDLDFGTTVAGNWSGQIPAQPFLGFVSYYIIATDRVGNVGRSPSEGEHVLIIGDGVSPSLVHTPLGTASAGSQVTFNAAADDNVGVFVVRLYIKPIGSPHFNPPINMQRVGLTDDFQAMVEMPNEDGDMYYYIEAVDEWGNVATSGDSSSPHKLSVTGAPIDWGGAIVWGLLFSVIAIVYLGMFLSYRRRALEDEEEKEEDEKES